MLQRFPTTRMRRLRQHTGIRQLVSENKVVIGDLILPLFIKAGGKIKNPIAAMPGHFQISLDLLEEEVLSIVKLNIPGVILFGIPENKDEYGSSAHQAQGIIQQAIQVIKKIAPQLLIITDVCYCEYTHHGHCGVVTQKRGMLEVDNDKTLELLARQAVSHAQAGADVVAPSAMMDGMIQAIRQGLDNAGYESVPIISYSTKYASALYGPFREAAQSTPNQGDRRGYQMNPANGQEAIRESGLDLQEGADMLMVKPANAYLDVIYRVKQSYPGVPVGAYQVSGEYAMLKAAAANGWLDEKTVALEMLLAIKRAGADFIISYFAKDVAHWLGNMECPKRN